MNTLKNLSLLIKFVVLLAVVVFAVVLLNITISTTAQSSQSKRQLDDRVPGHLPIKIKIKKEKQEGFHDLKNDHWARDFVLEVKNTGDRPIYALSLAWMFEEVIMPDGSHYGSILRYGRSEFITNAEEKPKPEDVPIQPGETHVFKLSNSSIESWESWAKDNHVPQPKKVMVFFDWISFGDGTGWESPNGQRFDRRKSVAFASQPRGDPITWEQQMRCRESALLPGFSMEPASFKLANFLDRGSPSTDSIAPPDICQRKNGFIALAEFDKQANGGNEDGMIDQRDAAYFSLRLWQDSNHNGVSEPTELRSLSSVGLATIELDYKLSKKSDAHGNQFRYRAKVKDTRGNQLGRWAWDVLLVTQ